MSQMQPYGSPDPSRQVVGPPPAWGGQPGWAPGQVAMTDQRDPGTAVVVIAWVLAVITVGYMLPWAVAASRGKANHGAVALIDVLLGWSVIGWIVALVMACQAHQVIGAPMTMNVMVAQQFPQAHFAGPPPPVQAGPTAGWYAAPDGAGQRYWDGATWTAHTAP